MNNLDVDVKIDDLIRAQARGEKVLAKRLELLNRLRSTLELLPSNEVLWFGWSDTHVVITYNQPEVAEEIRSTVQQILGTFKADRILEAYTGVIKYQLDTDTIKVTIYGGSLAPGCELVSKEVTRTEYEIVCKEDNHVQAHNPDGSDQGNQEQDGLLRGRG